MKTKRADYQNMNVRLTPDLKERLDKILFAQQKLAQNLPGKVTRHGVARWLLERGIGEVEKGGGQ